MLLMAALRTGALQYVLRLVSDCFHIRVDCGTRFTWKSRGYLLLRTLPCERGCKQNDVQCIDGTRLCFIKQSVGYLFASLYNLDY